MWFHKFSCGKAAKPCVLVHVFDIATGHLPHFVQTYSQTFPVAAMKMSYMPVSGCT